MPAWPDIGFYALHFCSVVSALLYAVASVLYIRAVVFLKDADLPHTGLRRAHRVLQWAVALHAVFVAEQTLQLVWPQWFAEGAARLPGSAYSFSAVAWLLTGGYLLLRRPFPIDALGVFVAPLATALALLAALWFHKDRSPSDFEQSPLLLVHIFFSIFGHAAFVGAFLVSVALIVQETLLKKKNFLLVLRAFPPLRMLDSLNSLLLSTGVLAMSLGVLLGVVFAFEAHSPDILLSGRALWSLVTLSVYLALVTAIFIGGFRGRRAAWISVIGFATILCSFASMQLLGASFHVH